MTQLAHSELECEAEMSLCIAVDKAQYKNIVSIARNHPHGLIMEVMIEGGIRKFIVACHLQTEEVS